VKRWAAENGVPFGPAIRQDPRLLARLQQAIDTLNAKQASYSTVKKWAILDQDFTTDGGELTPTLKVKRKLVTQRYRALLDSFYAE
jgi:long-chain acyl-CoA synthetase